MINIWLVEDEATIADTLVYRLEEDNYRVCWFERGELLLEALLNHTQKRPALIILDVGLPDILGFDLARIVLDKYDIPIIFLTARIEEIDRIVGLEIGADDYVAKPFSPRELSARVKAVLRRSLKQQVVINKFSVGPFILDEQSAFIRYYNDMLSLTRYEYLLLKTFIRSPNRVFSRAQLMELVWQDNLESMERTIDTHIKTIRQKLVMIEPSQKPPILTHRGLGYSLTI
ncbi:two-component system response regulator CreB [Orbus mooreae]|uniref:two-component system response regulator CreB n=1 Tax=Orbus mooreae TaxID=3074107 RepID=UPI00370D04B8